MEKVLIYPFDRKTIPLVKHFHLIEGMELTTLVAPRGWRPLQTTFYVGDKEIKIEYDFEKALENCTLIWLVDSEQKISTTELIYPQVKKAIEQNKKILCTKNLEQKELGEFFNIVPIENRYSLNEREKDILAYSLEFFDIDTPIIFICGMFCDLEKFEIQLTFREEFLKQKLKLLQIGSRKCSEVFGFYSLPDYLYNNDVSERDKILMFNQYLKRKEIEEKPDVIIIGIPGDVLPYSRKVVGNFGTIMNHITQTIIPDCVIFSMPYYSNLEVTPILSRQMWKKYNFGIDYFFMCNKMIESSESTLSNKMIYLTVDEEEVQKRVSENKLGNVYCLSMKENVEELAGIIVKQLRMYGTMKLM